MDTCDFLIIGGGIIGISIARELKRRHPHATFLLLEKKEGYGLHASGRNSWVLHAGFYYKADSFKAKFT
jgi:(S)-2-hydroxyglutarate dehydrogenase